MNDTNRFLPGVPAAEIEAAINAAPGNEISSGKFDNPESSARLAVNAFGFFIPRPAQLPALTNCDASPANSVAVEKTLRFPWAGGNHPVLDAVVETATAIIGVESKRFEPFRGAKQAIFRKTYWRDVWGENMRGYKNLRDALCDGGCSFQYLDAVQLIKHAFALRTTVHKDARGRLPILFYVYAEPKVFTNQREITTAQHRAHRQEIKTFAAKVADDEVKFVASSYHELLTAWQSNSDAEVASHATRVRECFSP